MRLKFPKTIVALSVVVCIFLGYWLWLSLSPVEIIAIHHRSSGFSDVLVRNLSFTDKGKINWWLENRNKLKEQYKIPNPESDGLFSVTFWLFGDRYKEDGKYDRLCFDDMKTKRNCIEKDAVLTVDKSPNLGVTFTVYDGYYHLDKSGEITKA